MRGGFDAIVEIDEAPGELAREQRADGGLARAHEAGEAEQRYALLRRQWGRGGWLMRMRFGLIVG